MDRSVEGGRVNERAAGADAKGIDAVFSSDQVARAFDVEEDRVHRAMHGEFGMAADGTINSRQAQQIAEVMLADEPLDQQEAKLMKLGAYTPRFDDEWGLGDTAPGEESDRLSHSADKLEDEAPSKRASYDPAYTSDE
ncbi:MAG TPA: hypothetical protein VGR16_04090 [Thermomicrobiales bacterium]|nr:hypothetical protein [Thermomicrobiales bacterium]